jgi:hypothetical protein
MRCGITRSVAESGYCVTCVFALRAEIEDGLSRLADYLARWAAYADWCDGRDLRDLRDRAPS